MSTTHASKVRVIAEAGVNHNGSTEMALRLVDVAADSGAEAVKFQTFRADALASAAAPKAAYQMQATGNAESQLLMLQRLQMSEAMHEAVAARAAARGIEFLSTPFDEASLGYLTERMGMRTIKVPSGEITNGPLLLAVAQRAQQVILSTGMSTLGEVEAALGVLAFGFVGPSQPPGLAAFERAACSTEGRAALRSRVTLLHCTSEYPAPLEDVNLAAMQTLASAFGLRVGYSDHTVGIHVSIAAVALGAVLIEKHFTLDRSLPGPDHRASLEPRELAELVRCVSDVVRAKGSSLKFAAPSELATRSVARKSLVAARAIAPGEPLTADNMTSKRPGTGASPMLWWQRLGTRAGRTYAPDEALD